METKYTKYLFIVALAIIVLLSFLIVKPLINVFLWSFILSYLFYPLYVFLNRHIRRPTLSSLLTVLIMVLVVTVPFFMIVRGISAEVFTFYTQARAEVSSGQISLTALTSSCAQDSSFLCDGIRSLEKWTHTLLPEELMKQVSSKLVSASLNIAIAFILNVPSMLFHIAIAFFITFFLLRDWEKFRKSVYEFVPFKSADMEKILHRINTMTHSILFASILVAFIQAILGMIGFWVVGFQSPILLGAIMGFFALIPVGGTGIIWLPASLYLAGKGMLLGTDLYIYQGIGLFLYGLLIISTLDNFLRPKLAGDAAKIHPVVIIAGVIGGVSLFGFVGIFVGPVILSLLITFVTLAIEKYHLGPYSVSKEK